MNAAITFDFHDTLVSCPAWFDLEVRALAGATLRAIQRRRGERVDADAVAAADASYKRLRAAIIVHGHELAADRCVAHVFRRIGYVADASEIAAAVDDLMRETLADASAVPGAVETTRMLAGSDAAVGVVSSAVHHPFLLWSLERFGFPFAPETIVTSASAGFYKSRPEIYWRAWSLLDAAPAHCLHVGDSYRWDVEGAITAGGRGVWLLDPDRPIKPNQPSGDRAAQVLSTLEDAAPILDRLLRTPPA